MNSIYLGRIIRYHRKAAGLTQIELADLAGLGKTVIYDIEKGKETVQWRSVKSLLNALNIKIKLESPLMEKFIKHEKS
ncbi:MAG: helix-turn-helix domain-containing protein [Bacteroidota bacterium]